MKLKELSLLFTLILICASVPLTVEAQTHTLEWGVEVGEEFTYVMQRAYYATPVYEQIIGYVLPYVPLLTVGEKYILRVTELNPIPTLINESSQMPNSIGNLERVINSTTIVTGLLDFVIPIGDWDFLNQMTNLTGFSDVTLIDTDEEWGSKGSYTYQAPDGSAATLSIDIRYEKENGTLNYLRHRYSTLGNDLVDVIIVNWHPGMPTRVSGGLQTTTILIISISAVVGVIVSVLVYQGFRRKKPIVQRLGE